MPLAPACRAAFAMVSGLGVALLALPVFLVSRLGFRLTLIALLVFVSLLTPLML